jgi:ribosomal protein L37AE/L43A
MKKLVCEMCGGSDLIKQDGVFACQHCGAKYSVEEAKKMMVEGTVAVTG